MANPRFTAKIETEAPTPRLAVLIDADNAQASIIERLLEEIAGLGEATVKRIYGDFTAPTSASWKKVLQKFAVKPVQQFAYTTGKNATDSSLIIDAMDLLYTQTFDGFCLVSSDSDFTGLAMRLREGGLKVYGFGEQKTPEAFRSACHKFTFTENLRNETQAVITPDSEVTATKTPQDFSEPVLSPNPSHNPKELPKELLLTALDQSADDTGWATLSAFGSYINNVRSDFDPRTYNYKKLSDLVRAATDLFIVDERPTNNSQQKIIHLRAKK